MIQRQLFGMFNEDTANLTIKWFDKGEIILERPFSAKTLALTLEQAKELADTLNEMLSIATTPDPANYDTFYVQPGEGCIDEEYDTYVEATARAQELGLDAIYAQDPDNDGLIVTFPVDPKPVNFQPHGPEYR